MHRHPELPGEHINLRPIKIEDAALTFDWRDGTRSSLLNKGASNIDEQAKWIDARPSTEVNFIIETKKSLPIGMISLIKIDFEEKQAESARFLIGDEQTARGIPAAVEAMKLLYDFSFIKLALNRVYGSIASGNKLMIKWQKYMGMQEYKRVSNHYFLNDVYQDAVCLDISASDYKTVALPKMNALIGFTKKG